MSDQKVKKKLPDAIIVKIKRGTDYTSTIGTQHFDGKHKRLSEYFDSEGNIIIDNDNGMPMKLLMPQPSKSTADQ